MKKVVFVLSIILVASITTAFAQEENNDKKKSNSKISEVSLICKMDCESCSNKVNKQLAFTKGVKFVEADHEKDVVVVKYRNDKTDTDKIIASLAEIDYVAKVKAPCCGDKTKKPCASQEKSGCSGSHTQTKTGCAGSSTKTGCSGTHATPCGSKKE
jgi:copper chaperone CopZ